MFGKAECLFSAHDWHTEDYDEEVNENGHEIGEEIFIRCHRCKKVMMGIEKLSNNTLKWNAYDKQAILYDINPEYLKKQDPKQGIEKFREENK